jgi:hypothetical protein
MNESPKVRHTSSWYVYYYCHDHRLGTAVSDFIPTSEIVYLPALIAMQIDFWQYR